MSDINTTHKATPPPETSSEVTRRRFMTLLFGSATAIGLGGFLAPLARFAYPVIHGQVYEKLKVAVAAEVTIEGIRFDYQDVPSELIILEDKSFAAYSLVCTHLGCIVKWEPKNNDFHCPCHAGKFDTNGQVISGPPPSPLTKYKVVVEAGNVYVEGIA
ncbi:MAG: QcrA and Rieske domain-containing protein [Thermoleophilia bacterium]